jgi:alkylhydroperoxidase family enzyme
MEARIDYRQFSSEALQGMLAIEKYLSGCGLDHKLMHVLKLRASQLNGCAYSLDMHFSEKEIVDLTYVAATINAWNRIAIALRAVPGRYKPAGATTA